MPLEAEVVTLDGYSAHADRSELGAWLDAVSSASTVLPRVLLVHGEPPAQAALSVQLADEGIPRDGAGSRRPLPALTQTGWSA